MENVCICEVLVASTYGHKFINEISYMNIKWSKNEQQWMQGEKSTFTFIDIKEHSVPSLKYQCATFFPTI